MLLQTEGALQLHPLPDRGQDEPRGADEVGATGLPSGQGNDPNGGIGERDARLDRRPASEGRALQAERAKQGDDAAEEAFYAAALAQFIRIPRRWL